MSVVLEGGSLSSGRMDKYSAPLYRGELLLTNSELSALNEQLRISGFAFEQTVEPEITKPINNQLNKQRMSVPSFGSGGASVLGTGSAVLGLSGQAAAQSGKTTVSSVRLPQKRVTEGKIRNHLLSGAGQPAQPFFGSPANQSSSVDLSGWRSEILKVVDTLLRDSSKQEHIESPTVTSRESIPYWFSQLNPPEIVDSISEIPTCLSSMRAKILDGHYASHFEFQADLTALTEFVFSRYGIYSTPFQVAMRLRREASLLMVDAVKNIKNESLFTIPMPVPEALPPSDDEFTPRSSKSIRSTISAKPSIQAAPSQKSRQSTTKPAAAAESRKSAAADVLSEQRALLQRLAELEKQVETMNRGGVDRPMTSDEVHRLEIDFAQLPNPEIKKLVDGKLKGQPGLSFDADGSVVIEIGKMTAQLQRYLRRHVTMKLNEMKGQPSAEKIRKIAKQDSKAKQNEEMIERMLKDRKRLRELEEQKSAESASQLKRIKSNEQQEHSSFDPNELARLRELKERDENAKRILELMSLDVDADDSLD